MLILGLATGYTLANEHLQSYANRGLKRAGGGHALPRLDQPADRTPEEGPQVPQGSHKYVSETIQPQSNQLRAKEMPNELSALTERINVHHFQPVPPGAACYAAEVDQNILSY